MLDNVVGHFHVFVSPHSNTKVRAGGGLFPQHPYAAAIAEGVPFDLPRRDDSRLGLSGHTTPDRDEWRT